MKGNEAEYVIPLRRAFTQPKGKRTRKAINIIREFARKHSKMDNILITAGANNLIGMRSRNIPRRIEALLVKDNERLLVFLKGSKDIEEFRKLKEEEEKSRREKKKAQKEEKKREQEKETEERERKKKEKKTKETAAEKAAIKRKTGQR